MKMAVTNAWPSNLPLPQIDHQGQWRNTTLVGPVENAAITRRMRKQRSYAVLNVRWMLSLTQWDNFQTYVNTTLSNATAIFSIDLRYPKTSVLTNWAVRFTNEYSVQSMDGMWQVTGQLDLFGKTLLADFAF